MTRPFIIGCWRELTNVSDCQPLQSLSLILVTDRTHINWIKSEGMSYLYKVFAVQYQKENHYARSEDNSKNENFNRFQHLIYLCGSSSIGQV